MKTATLPAVRVSPETRTLIESVLKEGETLSTFIEESAKRQAGWRKEDEAFYARALRASELVKAGKMRTHTQEEVMTSLRNIIEAKKRDKAPAKQSLGK
ncbi:MAG: prevent-host-death protein [Polaromonas sp.]|nr:prevent-host-death protein [Polaromonas sp.]